MSDMKWHLQRQFGLDTLQLLLTEQRNGKLYRAARIELKMVEHDRLAPIPEPTLELHPVHAQAFLEAMADMLHEEKIKPTVQSFIEGKLEATEKHLDDMRKLVFEPDGK